MMKTGIQSTTCVVEQTKHRPCKSAAIRSRIALMLYPARVPNCLEDLASDMCAPASCNSSGMADIRLLVCHLPVIRSRSLVTRQDRHSRWLDTQIEAHWTH